MRIKGFAAAAALSVAGVASAATGPGSLGNIDNSTVVIGNTMGKGLFTDVYSFDVSNTGIGIGAVLDFALDTKPRISGPEFDIDFKSISFVDLSTSAVLAADTNGSDGWSLASLLPHHGGSFAFVVKGTAVGNFGGTYLGTLSTIVPHAQPVPEPETYALLLAGLGVVGFVARRRRA
jgi:hypothetical protein